MSTTKASQSTTATASDENPSVTGAFGSCPLPIFDHPNIVMGHGSGGKLSAELIDKIFVQRFRNPILDRMDDQAVLEIGGMRLAFTTDSFVVTPLFFPGGDIGHLAVNGTVNDLAMCGARPLYLSAAFILEEGLPTQDLARVVESMRDAANAANIQLVTGDTKVVNRGKGDKVFITTTGIGIVDRPTEMSADRAQPGDKVILSGFIGDHGITILSQREHLEFESDLKSDCAPLHSLVEAMLNEAEANGNIKGIRCMRDPTRGGVATVLNEIARKSHVGMRLHESSIPVRESVRGACEVLGLDPLYVANEGKLLAVVAPQIADQLIVRMRKHPLGTESQIIGEITGQPRDMVLMKTSIGGTRVVDVLFGEQMPRIC
ncbi:MULTISPECIES: hydrogenase expression/formation protein HypE [Acidobacterium]|uniref:Hydrogenase expression/formation protein HypE n=1 Tax=Acidobacterium capsulatum (strain ATCC 51196 / DSM 11244 / BCRC 80197 / JCM 7670 / NBRC 15755 / NCIMB 13165 / 161) TaxID=240015 RepID=C1F4L5_ACIC5|nr:MULTISPECIES: hydrogenase expression/formation protein HypE [Acidobacterium]ACO34013.1 hydrogenase expression/formation protein HypE [Acidobacterium capsulatum ATCC 51196]HCT61831.1 hydrogenase expression/formation protein HypE [Acidobacterium sp.]